MQQALRSNVGLQDMICLPAGMCEAFGRGDFDDAKDMLPVSVSRGGLFNFTAAFADSDFECVKCAWKHHAVSVGASERAHNVVVLGTADMEHALLGDVIGYCLCHLQGHAKGALVGMAFLLLRQFGTWLARHVHELFDYRPAQQVPEARTLFFHTALLQASKEDAPDPADMSAQALAKGRVFAYCRQVANSLAMAPTKTRTFVTDGWRGKGEGLELYYAFSPDLNLGGYLPFQVPFAACFAWLLTSLCHRHELLTEFAVDSAQRCYRVRQLHMSHPDRNLDLWVPAGSWPWLPWPETMSKRKALLLVHVAGSQVTCVFHDKHADLNLLPNLTNFYWAPCLCVWWLQCKLAWLEAPQ